MQKTKRIPVGIFVFLSLLTFVPNVYSASKYDVNTLRANLLSGYNRHVRPVTNQTDAINVSVGLRMLALQEFDEVREKFSFLGVFIIKWRDDNFVWDSANYSGINILVMGYKEVWKPEIILTNPSEKVDSFGNDWQLIRYTADGYALYVPGTLIKATCSINAYYFPFDVQKCNLEVFALGYSYQEVSLSVDNGFIDTHELAEHGSWTVIKTHAKTSNSVFASKVNFIIWFERKPEYVVVNIIFPLLFLCLLNVLVFLLPPESGERVSYSITVLLSIAVFMTILNDILPKTSEPLPIISYLMMISLTESSVITIAITLNLLLYHKNNNESVPDWLACICQRLKNCCTRRRRKDSKQQTATEERNSTPLKTLILGSTNKVEVLHVEPQLQEMAASFSCTSPISWQYVSMLIDYVLLVISASLTIICFSVFMIVIKAARE